MPLDTAPENNPTIAPEIYALESGGAHHQVNTLDGIMPINVVQDVNGHTNIEIDARILGRGPFGVGLNALHPSDLYELYKQLAVAHGAANGRQVTFKIFEAQGNPKEYEASSWIMKMLKDEGLKVGIEIATSYTATEKLTPDHYAQTTSDILDVELQDFLGLETALVGVTLKDMIGGLEAPDENGDVPEHANTAILMNKQIDVLKAKGLTPDKVYTGQHSHDTGYALDANVASTTASHTRGYKSTADFTVGGIGFAQLKEYENALESKGVDPSISNNVLPVIVTRDVSQSEFGNHLLLNHPRLLEKYYPRFADLNAAKTREERDCILDEMAFVMDQVCEEHAQYQIDPNAIPGDKRRWAKIPGGAVPTTMTRHVAGLINDLDITPQEAIEKITTYMNQAWEDLGLPHSVTPGADFLGATARIMAKNVANGKSGAALYDNLTPELVEYWRGKMPHNQDPAVLENLSRQHIKHVFSDKPELRDRLLEQPANKDHARDVFEENGFGSQAEHIFERDDVIERFEQLRRYAFYLNIAPEDRFAHDQEKRGILEFEQDRIEAELENIFKEAGFSYDTELKKHEKLETLLNHVGQRTLSIAHGVEPRLPIIKNDYDRIQGLGSMVSWANLVVAALINKAGPDGGVGDIAAALAFKGDPDAYHKAHVITKIRKPSDLHDNRHPTIQQIRPISEDVAAFQAAALQTPVADGTFFDPDAFDPPEPVAA